MHKSLTRAILLGLFSLLSTCVSVNVDDATNPDESFLDMFTCFHVILLKQQKDGYIMSHLTLSNLANNLAILPGDVNVT